MNQTDRILIPASDTGPVGPLLSDDRLSAAVSGCSRRTFLTSAAVAAAAGAQAASTVAAAAPTAESPRPRRARIAITLDLEMSRMYPRREMMEWDYQKGNLNKETRQYALDAAKLASDLGAVIHFFCVGRVLEQPDVRWLKQIHEMGHPVGNHTYDHVNVWAQSIDQVQFRFRRSPWLVEGMDVPQIIRHNIRLTTMAMKQRLGFGPDGFRTPGGSYLALDGREDLQQMLLDEGFTWVSSRYPRHEYSTPGSPPSDAVFSSIVKALKKSQPYRYPTGLIEVPMSPISDVGAFRTSRWKRADFLKSIQQCVTCTIEHGGVFDFLCHPSIMYVEDPDFEAIQLICRLVREAGDRAEIVGLGDIAKIVG